MSSSHAKHTRRRLGETLVSLGHITAEQLQDALEAQRSNGFRLGTNLLIKGYLEEEDLARFLSEQMGLPSVDRIDAVGSEVRQRVPADIAQLRVVFPLGMAEDRLLLAMADPSDKDAIAEVEACARCRVKIVVAPELVVSNAIWKQYRITPDPETADLWTEDFSIGPPEHETWQMDQTV